MALARVLVVDDDADIVEVLRIILESGGYAVTEALSPKEAHRQLGDAPPDLILLDVMMPNEAEGLTFLRQLRGDYPPALAETPVVLLSAIYDLPRVRSAARLPEQAERVPLELPVQAFLPKPPEPSVLLATVANVLQSAS